MMKIPVQKIVKASENSGTIRISIPNMVHTVTNIENGDQILFKTMTYNENSDEFELELKKIKGKNNDKEEKNTKTSNIPNRIRKKI